MMTSPLLRRKHGGIAPALPPDPLAARIGDLIGWWLEVECGCGRSASFPFRWMVEVRNIPADKRLADVMPSISLLEPIWEVWLADQGFAAILRSMRRILARRTNTAALRARRS